MKFPLISIIVASYNSENTIRQCIESILTQTYVNKEFIIIDGASNDNTVDIIKSYSTEINYWESSPDKGIYDAWNKALARVKGEWICFIGADDYFWDKYVLEKIGGKLYDIKGETINIVYGKVVLVDSAGEVIRVIGNPWQEAKKKFFRHMSIPHPGLMHNKIIFDTYGKYDEKFTVAGDYELLLRGFKFLNALFIPDIIVVGMRTGGISTQGKNAIKIHIEEAKARNKNHIHSVDSYWVKEFFNILLTGSVSHLFGKCGLKYFDKIKHKLKSKA